MNLHSQLFLEVIFQQILCSNLLNNESDWEHSAVLKVATEDFPVLLASSDICSGGI
jgi:hypothetical protein